MNSQDGVYDRSKPRQITQEDTDPGIRYDYMGPFKSFEDALLSQALNVITMPREEVARVVRPRLPQLQLFRPTQGYRTRALGINDIIEVNQEQPPTRVDFTGGHAGYQGTERNAQSGGFW